MSRPGAIPVNTELERYLRLLHVAGIAGEYPWSIRAFSPAEADRLLPRDTAHPWAARHTWERDTADAAVRWVSPEVGLRYNTTFPYGQNDGPVWAGRGLTTAIQGGVVLRYGALSLTVAPLLFRAENAHFRLAPNGRSGDSVYADYRSSGVDVPQRFGDGPYMRLDAGQSTLRMDSRGLAVGVSSANQHWGPAVDYPLVLGSNAGGFWHVFFGTAAPVNVGVGRLHGRTVWGRLEQSGYALSSAIGPERLMGGLVATFMPAGLPGLEVGFARFFHDVWPDSAGWNAALRKPFETFFKIGIEGNNVDRDDDTNQVASGFARWAFPGSGLELYGEYAREDHAFHLRDFLLQPDHSSGYMLGFRRVWERPGDRLLSVRGEILNTQRSQLGSTRWQGIFYTHHLARQGHTHRGQFLGSEAGLGGGGATFGVDHFHPGGRVSVAWTRTQRTQAELENDVIHSLGAELLRFHGRYDLSLGLTGAYNLNRNLSSDVFNFSTAVGVRLHVD